MKILTKDFISMSVAQNDKQAKKRLDENKLFPCVKAIFMPWSCLTYK